MMNVRRKGALDELRAAELELREARKKVLDADGTSTDDWVRYEAVSRMCVETRTRILIDDEYNLFTKG